MNAELKKRLESLAWKRSIPFCYLCYRPAPSGRCSLCWSDDLMRLIPDVGPEYGIDWVVRHLVKENVETLDTDEAFEESISQCYPETTKIGWIEFDTVSAIKDLDPVSWDLAMSEWLDSEEQDEQVVTLDNGGTYYRTCDVESFLDDAEAEEERGAA